MNSSATTDRSALAGARVLVIGAGKMGRATGRRAVAAGSERLGTIS